MMRLLIQFADAELESLRWSVFDETSATLDLEWQAAEESELSAIGSQNPHPAILLIPQQCVYLAQVNLPEKAGRQILSSIEFQVEDQLAQDIETQHFALGDHSENPISLAVVDKTIMRRCLDLAASHGLRILQILPELYWCPNGESVNLCAVEDGLLIRYDSYHGFKCQPPALPTMLELVRQDRPFSEVTCYGVDTGELPQVEGVAWRPGALSDVKPGFLTAPVIELQQREFQMSTAWIGLAKTWKWIAILFLGLTIAFGYNRAIALSELENQLSELKSRQYELLRPHLPPDVTAEDDLKKFLIERMKQLQQGQQEAGFMQLLVDFTRARAKYPQVRITRIGYQNQRLNIDISDLKLQNIESLHADLQRQGIDAKLENLSIKPELISGRLVLQGGANG